MLVCLRVRWFIETVVIVLCLSGDDLTSMMMKVGLCMFCVHSNGLRLKRFEIRWFIAGLSMIGSNKNKMDFRKDIEFQR